MRVKHLLLLLVTLLVVLGMAAVVLHVRWSPRSETFMDAMSSIEKQGNLRERFHAAHRAIQDLGVDVIISELQNRKIESEAEQVLLIETARTRDSRTRPMLEKLANSDGPLSRFARAALDALD